MNGGGSTYSAFSAGLGPGPRVPTHFMLDCLTRFSPPCRPSYRGNDDERYVAGGLAASQIAARVDAGNAVPLYSLSISQARQRNGKPYRVARLDR